MTAKPAKPEKRKLAPRSGTLTRQDAADLQAEFVELAGSFAAICEKMKQSKIEAVTFDGGNVIKRIVDDAKLYLIDLEGAVKKAVIRYPGISG